MKLFCAATFVCLLLLASCGKENSGIPDVPVQYHITLDEFQAKNKDGLLFVNNYGVAGLIICKRADNDFITFDRCSTVNPEKRCAVIPDNPNLTATDTCSGGKFSLYDGSPVKAPAKTGLKVYYTVVSGFDIQVIN